jgi:hypothetical protein
MLERAALAGTGASETTPRRGRGGIGRRTGFRFHHTNHISSSVGLRLSTAVASPVGDGSSFWGGVGPFGVAKCH